MIAYLPPIYEDELFYSWLCRVYAHSGYLSYKVALQEMLYSKSNNPSIEFIGHLNQDFDRLLRRGFSIKDLIVNHTMLPQYARFIPNLQKEKALYHLELEYCDAHHLFSILPRSEEDLYLKYCPACLKEDRERCGEAYWHRIHQIRTIKACPKHACYLEKSSIPAKSENLFSLFSAEEHTVQSDSRKAPKGLVEYCKYLSDIFQLSMQQTREVPVCSIFYYALRGSQYMPKSTKVRNTQKLYADMKKCFTCIEVDIASYGQVQKVLLGCNKYEFFVVCQIAFFLGISVDDLTASRLTDNDIKIEQESHYMQGKEIVDWEALDEKMSARLKGLAYHIYYGDEMNRPSKVSERLVYEKLKLNAHSLSKLPACRKIIKKYEEDYEDLWARRLIWAYNKLLREEKKKHIFWSDIRELSGVKKKHIRAIEPKLFKYANRAQAETILKIISL